MITAYFPFSDQNLYSSPKRFPDALQASRGKLWPHSTGLRAIVLIGCNINSFSRECVHMDLTHWSQLRRSLQYCNSGKAVCIMTTCLSVDFQQLIAAERRQKCEHGHGSMQYDLMIGKCINVWALPSVFYLLCQTVKLFKILLRLL